MASNTPALSNSVSTAPTEEKGEDLDLDVAPDAPVTFPDGGWAAWSALFGVWLLQFSTFGYTNAFAVYQDFYVRVYLSDYPSSTINWIGSVQLCLILSMGLFTGRAFDQGYFYHLMASGTALFAVCIFTLSVAKPQHFYQIFLAQGLGIGIAFGLMYVPSVGLVSHYFHRRRTLALGILASGASMGGIVHPIMINRLFHGSVGFKNGVRVSGGMIVGLLLLSCSLMRTRLPPKQATPYLPHLRAFIRDPPYLAVVCAVSVILFGLYDPIFFLQLFAIKHGIDSNLAFNCVTIMNAANLVGRILPSILAGHIGVLNTHIPSAFLSGLLIFTMLAVKNVAGTVVFSILFGFTSGAYISLIPPTVAVFASDISEIGARLGTCLAVSGLFGLVGSPVAGALLGSDYDWWKPLLFAGCMVTFGSSLLGLARFLIGKRKATGWRH